jgi:hypothetical protein
MISEPRRVAGFMLTRRTLMHSMRFALRLPVTLWIASIPIAAAAQPPANPPAFSGPMEIEQLHDGFAVAPEFKISTIDGRSAQLAGAFGGWMVDNTLLIGGGGYWLTNRSSNRTMGYGGAVVEWLEWTGRPVGLSVRGLIGLGEATLANTVTVTTYGAGSRDEPYNPHFPVPRPLPTPVTTTVSVGIGHEFFVAEPQANLLINISRRMRVNVGVGYRAIGGTEGIDNRLRGATGSIALELGGSSSVRLSPP